jgi:hypothetical protein
MGTESSYGYEHCAGEGERSPPVLVFVPVFGTHGYAGAFVR